MNIRISLPSGVNEGENLPLQFALPDSSLEAPRVDCGFTGLNCDVLLRREVSGGWRGVANVHSGLAGHAFLKFRLTDPSHPVRGWEGEVGVRFAPRQQAAPIHITGVDSSAEKSGMGQANSVNITVNGLASGGTGTSGQAQWQEIEVTLHECALPVSLRSSPAPAPVPPVNPAMPDIQTVSSSHATGAAPPPASGSRPESTKDTVLRGHSMTIAAAMLILIGVVSYLAISNRERGADVVKPTPHSNLASHPSASNISQAGSTGETADFNANSSSGLHAAPAEASTIQKEVLPVKPPTPELSSPAIEIQGLATTYQSGDYLRLKLRLGKPGYVRLLTCDPDGAIVQLYPSKLDVVKELPSGSWIFLPDPEIIGTRAGFGYECYLPDGRSRENTRVLVQWSPYPFDQSVMRGIGEFYAPEKPATWGEIATRGVRINLGTAVVESKNLTFDVVKPQSPPDGNN